MSAAIDSSANAAQRRKNVLFIGVDDQNASLGCYTNGLVHTPHLDNLAERGTRFDAAYCQYPLCSPSRTSLMTGMAPDSTKVYDNLAPSFRSALPSTVTLSQLFRKNGYFSARVGKIYHQGVPARIGESGPDDPKGWDYVFNPCGVDHTKEEPLVTNFGPDIGDLGKEIAFRESEAPDKSMTDSLGADEVIRLLRQRHSKPFFLAYGLYRPHVPWIVPKAYFDLYPLESIQVCPFSEAELTVAPAAAYTTHPANYGMSEMQMRQAIRAYRASSSFMDAQVGRVLAVLRSLGLEENTIVVFWADHGWSLGEHGQWQKRNLFESSTRVPLLIAAPGIGSHGQICRRTVESLDIYPTLVNLCGLSDAPSSLQGTSLHRLLHDPDAKWDRPAMSQVVRGTGSGDAFGYSLRTERYRYTAWFGKETGEELYDYSNDPRELVNLANHPETDAIKASLRKGLKDCAASRGRRIDI
jgi:uncharacterized sulfatase